MADQFVCMTRNLRKPVVSTTKTILKAHIPWGRQVMTKALRRYLVYDVHVWSLSNPPESDLGHIGVKLMLKGQ